MSIVYIHIVFSCIVGILADWLNLYKIFNTK